MTSLLTLSLPLVSCVPEVTEEEGEEAAAPLPSTELTQTDTEDEEAAQPEEDTVTEEEEEMVPAPTQTVETTPSTNGVTIEEETRQKSSVIPGNITELAPWPMFKGNPQHTGLIPYI